LLLFTVSAAVAQTDAEPRDGPRGERFEKRKINKAGRAERFARIKVAKEAFLTEKLALTEAEAAAFFPIYHDYQQRMRDDKKERRGGRGNKEARENPTEDQARQLIAEQRLERSAHLELRNQMVDKFLTVLPATKVIQLPKAEREFRKELWSRAKKQRGGKGRGPR